MSLELEITSESATGPGCGDHEPATLVKKLIKRFDIALHDDAFKYVVTGVPNRVRLDDRPS